MNCSEGYRKRREKGGINLYFASVSLYLLIGFTHIPSFSLHKMFRSNHSFYFIKEASKVEITYCPREAHTF